MRDFKRYRIWQESHILVIDVYRIVENFPHKEEYRLTSQLLRAIYSIPSNIAEGCGRETDKDFKRFLSIAAGSANEAQYFLLLAKDLEYITEEEFIKLENKLVSIRKGLSSLQSKLKS